MARPTIPPPPPDEEGVRLYRSLFTSDATAPCDFARAYLPHLAAWLRAVHRRAGADLCDDAAAEAVYNVLRRPETFDPERGMRLLGYLRMAAAGDLRNRLRSEARHRHEPFDENSVELHAVARKDGRRGDDPVEALRRREGQEEARAFLRELRAALDERDREVLDRMAAGERRGAAFAAVLGVAHLPCEERDAAVKRAKDRILARARRMRESA